jgi:hypothetical protein
VHPLTDLPSLASSGTWSWSRGSVPSDFDFLMSFVAHVTDTYPPSVFDVAPPPCFGRGKYQKRKSPASALALGHVCVGVGVVGVTFAASLERSYGVSCREV